MWAEGAAKSVERAEFDAKSEALVLPRALADRAADNGSAASSARYAPDRGSFRIFAPRFEESPDPPSW